MANTPGTALAPVSVPSESKTKKISRTIFASAMSVGLIGTFALPAFAAVQPEAEPLASVAPVTQGFRTDTLPAPMLTVDSVPVEDNVVLLERVRAEEAAAAEEERLAQAEAAAERSAAAATAGASTETQSVVYPSVPVGAGSGGILSAAYSQLGAAQDCTALVERSLRAIGHPVGDLGTALWQYQPYGTQVALSDIQPGDILIYGNKRSGAHVAIAAGNGQAVHGGFPGGTVVAGVHAAWEPLTGAIRPH